MSSCFASLFYLALPGSCLARFAHFLAGLCSPSFFCSLLPSLFIPLPCLSQSPTQSLRKLAPCPPALVVKQIWTASIGGKLSQILAAAAAAAAAAALEALETHFETASEEMLWPTEGPVASTAGRTASPPAADGDGVQARAWSLLALLESLETLFAATEAEVARFHFNPEIFPPSRWRARPHWAHPQSATSQRLMTSACSRP